MFRDEEHFHGTDLRLARLARGLIRHRRAALALQALLFLVGLWGVSDLRLADDPNRWPPADDANVRLHDRLQRDFGGANRVTILITRKDGGSIVNHETLSVVKRITDHLLLEVDGVVTYSVRSLSSVGARYLRGTADLLDAGLLFPDPNRAPESAEELERTRFGIENNAMLKGLLVSPDLTAVIIQADFRTGHAVTAAGVRLPSTDPMAIFHAVNRIIAPENDAAHAVAATGAPMIIGWVNRDGLFDIAIAFGVAVIIIASILWYALRTLSGVLLPLWAGVLSALLGFACYRLFRGPMLGSAAALIAPFVVVAAAAFHGLQLLRRYSREELARLGAVDDAVTAAFVSRFRPLLAALLTDIVPFAVMAFIPFDNVRELGIVAACGLGWLTAAALMLMAPALSSTGRSASRRARSIATERPVAAASAEKFAAAFHRLTDRPRYGALALGACAALFIAAAWTIAETPVGQDNAYAIHNYLTRSWEGNEIFETEQQIRARFGGIDSLTVLAEGPWEGSIKTPAALTALDGFATAITQLDEVVAVIGLPFYVKIMNRFLSEDRDDAFLIPIHGRAEQAINEALYFYLGGLPGAFDAVADPTYRRAMMVVVVRDTGQVTVKKVSDAVRDYLDTRWDPNLASGVRLSMAGGSVGLAETFNRRIEGWLVAAAVLGFVGTILVLALLLRAAILPFVLILPPLLAAGFSLGVLIALGIEINSNAAAVLAVAGGVGVDSGIYLLYRVREEFAPARDFRAALAKGFAKIAPALVMSNAALLAGCWALAPIPLYVGDVGFGMGLVIFSCFVLTAVLSPILWNSIGKRIVIG